MVHLLCCTIRDQRSGTKPRQVQVEIAAHTGEILGIESGDEDCDKDRDADDT
jgi:hypothetical protein